MAKISFVMPCRNRGEIIGETIKSIISQTEKDWELIVVDDHSNEDDLAETVAKGFNDERIKFFRLADENGIGISAARNFGNIIAISEFIAVCDSDDIYYPDRISLTLDAFHKEGADVVYGDLDLWVEETGEVKKRPAEFAARAFDLNTFKKINFIAHPTVSYKRKIALDFPYNSFFRQSEDYDMMTRLAIHDYKFVFVSKPLVKYRVHAGSISSNTKLLYQYKDQVLKNRGWI